MLRRQVSSPAYWVSHVLRLVVVLASVASVSAQNTTVFSGPRDYPVGSLPESIVVADFNGDGRPDIAVANQSSNNLSVLLQNSDATFQPAVNYPVGNGPVSLQVGDFNKDGRMDLVVFNQTDNAIAVLLGNGDGTFQAQIVTAVAGAPLPYMVSGDFNGDGKTDVAIAEPLAQVGTYGVAILVGNGDGTFQSPVTYGVSSAPGSMVVADLNGDGKLDLVTGNSGLSVLLGNGDGTFQTAITSGSSLLIASPILLVADFNQDGHLDIATATYAAGEPNLTVFVGDGTGNFQGNVLPQIVIPLAAGDLSGDGAPDLVVSTIIFLSFTDSVPIENLINNGDGTFTAGQSLTLAGTPEAVLTDLNGDQNLDLVAALSSVVQSGAIQTNIVSVVQGNGDGTFRLFPSYSIATGTLLGTLAVADYNNDGKQDLDAGVLALGDSLNFTNVQLGSLLNDGAGFAPSTVTQVQTSGASYESAQVAAYVAAGDFNHDGKMDVAVAATAYIATGVSILLGNGDGTFQSAVQYAAGMSGPIALGDFNGDGVLDVVGVSPNNSNDVSVVLGNGDGTFGLAVNSASNSVVDALAVADFNHDNKLDVAALTGGQFGAPYQLTILLGNGDGTFSLGPTSSVGLYPTAVAAGDFNGDGIPDLVVANSESYDSTNSVYTPATVGVLLGNGDGSFQNPITVVVGSQIFTMAVADLNLDGKADVVLSNGGWNDVSLLLGNGDGTLQFPIQFFLGDAFNLPGVIAAPGGLAVADFDGNGAPDLAVAGMDSIFLLLNVGGSSAPSVVISPNALAFGSVTVGQASTPQAATLSYMASTALNNISITITGAQSSDYQQTNTCGTSLAAGAHCSINVTFSPQATGLRTAAVQISNSAGNSPQTVNLTGTGTAPPGIGLGIPQGGSNSATVVAGQTASYTLSIGGSGMSGTATLTCTGAPTGTTCSIPATTTVSGTTASSIQVSVSTITRSPASANAYRPITHASWVWGLVLIGIVLLPASSRKSNWKSSSLGAILLCLLLSSCGGSSSQSNNNTNGTEAGTYNLTVTADLSSATQTVTLQLIVQ